MNSNKHTQPPPRIQQLASTLTSNMLWATRLLTVLPVPSPRSETALPENISLATVFFPLVGALMGLALAAVAVATAAVLPSQIASGVVLISWVLLTGALHLDGLADTVDGLAAAGTSTQRLTVMKDPRTGAKAVIVLIVVLIAKYAVVQQIVATASWWILPPACALGRWAMVPHLYFIPYARKSGMASPFRLVRAHHLIAATAVLIGVLALFTGYRSFLPAVGAFVVSLVWSWQMRSKVGGYTGDSLGAVCQTAELAVLILYAASLAIP